MLFVDRCHMYRRFVPPLPVTVCGGYAEHLVIAAFEFHILKANPRLSQGVLTFVEALLGAKKNRCFDVRLFGFKLTEVVSLARGKECGPEFCLHASDRLQVDTNRLDHLSG